MNLTISLHWVKVLNFIKIYESQDSFGKGNELKVLNPFIIK